MSLVLGFVVGSVEIVAATSQTCIHDGEILIGQGEINHQFGFEIIKQCLQLLHVIGVHLGSLDVHVVSGLMYGINNLIAFFLSAAGNHKLGKHIGILCYLECRNGGYTTGSNHKYSSHFFIF